MEYNVSVLDFELRKAGLPIEGVSSGGKISWIGEPSQEQLDTAKDILADHNPDIRKTIRVSPLKDIAKAVIVKTDDGFDFSIAENINSMIKASKVGFWLQSVLALEAASFDKELIEMLEERIIIEVGEGNLSTEAANLLNAALIKTKKGLL